jgi:hypothetical protein
MFRFQDFPMLADGVDFGGATFPIEMILEEGLSERDSTGICSKQLKIVI